MDRPPLRHLARAIGAPAERRLAAVVGRLITEKLAFSGLDALPPQIGDLASRVDTVQKSLDALAVSPSPGALVADADALGARLDALLAKATQPDSPTASASEIDAIRSELRGELTRVMNVLQAIYDDEPENRRRLWRLRASAEYEHAFAESDPLVSVVIPTYHNFRALRERALPSALAQTYTNLEVIVVGDRAPAETGEVIDALNDGRVSFHNLERRGPYSEDPHKLWLVGGTPPYNTAVRLARGRWIAYLSDDDAFRPEHLQRLVSRAQADRLELCYGLLVHHDADDVQLEVGGFPPARGEFGFQAAIYHAGLADFLEFELTDAEFGEPVDWSLCRRMLRAGVRMGFVPEPSTDYYPSWHWGGRKERHAARQVGSDSEI
jgi:hypothetical protein